MEQIKVQVETYNGNTALAQLEPESIKQIDHNNSSDRKWLGSHCFWAMRNGRIVISRPL